VVSHSSGRGLRVLVNGHDEVAVVGPGEALGLVLAVVVDVQPVAQTGAEVGGTCEDRPICWTVEETACRTVMANV
jgi:hypothetical protein